MSSIDFEQSLKVADSIEARECLIALNISSYPHGKDEWKKKYHKEIHKAAYPPDPDKEAMAIEGLASLLSRGGK